MIIIKLMNACIKLDLVDPIPIWSFNAPYIVLISNIVRSLQHHVIIELSIVMILTEASTYQF